MGDRLPYRKGDPRAKASGRKGGQKTAEQRRAARHPYTGTILDAMDAAGCRDVSWMPWRAFFAATFGLPLPDDDYEERFRRHTQREPPPAQPVAEAWMVAGRRGGKSRMAALAALYLGVRFDAKVLAPGELAVIPVIARNTKQARAVFGYLKALCALPVFAPYVFRILQHTIELRTGVNLEVQAASFRTLRGYTIPGAVLDEVAFWAFESDSANPDTEIVDALRPGMATVPGALLVGISSPYARRGELYQVYERSFGQQDPHTLVWNADTRSMNPTISEAFIERQYEKDARWAASEYGRDGRVQFRHDVEAYLDPAAVQGVTIQDRRELPSRTGTRYVAFVDPSGGSQDSFTLAIAHREGADKAVLDCMRERRPPFSPDAVVEEFAVVLHQYGITTVTGDRYAGEWPRERFRAHDITYTPSPRTKSDLYREVLAPINAGRVELLDLPVLRAQLAGLERRVARGGKDSIDHAPGGRDDVANAVAGALVSALPEPKQRRRVRFSFGPDHGDYTPGSARTSSDALRGALL